MARNLSPEIEGLTMAERHEILARDRRTLEAVFRHPVPANLAWSDALHLLERLGSTRQEPNGMVLITIGPHRHAFHPPHSKELTPEDIRSLRRFFEEAGITPDSAAAREENHPSPDAAFDMVVTVDHHESRLFTVEGDSNTGRRLRPYDPHHFLHHLAHKQEQQLRGQRDAEESSYYALMIEELAPARRIVVLGHGTGNSSAAAHLEQLLRAKRPDIYARILAIRAVDLSALTEPQVLAIAEEILDSAV